MGPGRCVRHFKKPPKSALKADQAPNTPYEEFKILEKLLILHIMSFETGDDIYKLVIFI